MLSPSTQHTEHKSVFIPLYFHFIWLLKKNLKLKKTYVTNDIQNILQLPTTEQNI